MSFHPNEVIRRSRIASVLVAGVLIFLLSGFFRTQIIEHEQYSLRSEENRLQEIPLPAPPLRPAPRSWAPHWPGPA